MISRFIKSSIANRSAKSKSMLAGNLQYSDNLIAFAGNNRHSTVFPWSAAGFGTRYPDPSVPIIPTIGLVSAIKFSPSKKAIVIRNATAPIAIAAYKWDNGFGTKYADPGTLPGIAGAYSRISFSPNNNSIVVLSNTGIGVVAYPWDDSTGFGTKYTDPSTAPASPRGLVFSPSGNVLFISSMNYIQAYAWSSSTGFGTKYANTSPSLGINGGAVDISPTGDAVALVTNQSTPVTYAGPHAWQWNDSTGFGTKYTNPASAPFTAGGNPGVSFSPNNDAIAVAYGAFAIYAWSSSTGFGTKYTDPATLPSGSTYFTKFAKNGDAVAVSNNNTNITYVYPWSSSTGFGTRYADPVDWGVGTSVLAVDFA